MDSDLPEPPTRSSLGSFPSVGPVTYLTEKSVECRRLLKGPFPSAQAWFHGTTERAAHLACVQGIAPGCWIGAASECCGVLGHDSLRDFLQKREHLWIVEIFKKVSAIVLTCLFSLILVVVNWVPHEPGPITGPRFEMGRIVGFVLVLVGWFLSARWVVALFGKKQAGLIVRRERNRAG